MKNRVVGNDFHPEDGTVDFISEDGSRFTMPIDVLIALGPHARRVRNAQENKGGSPAPGWRTAKPLPVEAMQLGTMPSEKGPQIVLMLDPGTDVETLLAFPISHARELASELIRLADEAGSAAQSRN